MSDIMQNRRTREYKGSKFSQGRLKLSTSCGECHKRKQKCDQKQPCRHCARRFPQPPCVYRNNRDASTGSNGSPKESEAASNELTHYSDTPKDRIKTEISESGSLVTVSQLDDLVPDWLRDEYDPSECSVSMETLDQFDPNSYQNLLSTMVSRISSRVLAGSADSNATFLGLSNEIRTQLPSISYEQLSSYRNPATGAQESRNSPRHDLIPPPDNFSITSVDPLHFLGITPTVQSSELLQAFLKLITKYVVSIDGHATPNYYNDYWVPWSVKSPLLAYLGIFTAACYQAEALKISPSQSAVVLRYKCKVISLLNGMLCNQETSTSTEAIAGVVYLAVNEWYWSNYENVQAHMKGLKEMVRLRGGLDQLGMDEFPKRMILLMDYHISCSYNCDPTFPHDIEVSQSHPIHMNTPFVPAPKDPTSHTIDMQVSHETTLILDDMSFLMAAILHQVDREPSEKEKNKLEVTSIWTQNRISSLPDFSNTNDPSSRDYVYQSLRLAALIYCKAIISRTSLAKSCTLADLNQLWANMWQVKLSRWKQIPGIFLFIILAAIPAAQDTAHGRFLKSMLKTTSSYISLDYWDVVDGSLMAFVKLQRWLRNGGVETVKIGKQPPLEFLHIYGE